jgi:hypothetical protein
VNALRYVDRHVLGRLTSGHSLVLNCYITCGSFPFCAENMQLGKKQLFLVALLTGALFGGVFLVNVPNAYADILGINSTAGMQTWAASSNSINFARFNAASSGLLSSISLYAASISGSVAGGVGIYADSVGSPGALLAQGTATLVNGANSTMVEAG